MDETEIKERIEQYEESKKKIFEELKTKQGREREEVEYRIECVEGLIDHLYDRLNPTKKKEMYK